MRKSKSVFTTVICTMLVMALFVTLPTSKITRPGDSNGGYTPMSTWPDRDY